MEALLNALANGTRLEILLWVLAGGPKRQVEIVAQLAVKRGKPVNSGEVSALLKPLFEQGVLVRERKRGPISIRDRQQLIRLLQSVAAMTHDVRRAEEKAAADESDRVRRALLQGLSEAEGQA